MWQLKCIFDKVKLNEFEKNIYLIINQLYNTATLTNYLVYLRFHYFRINKILNKPINYLQIKLLINYNRVNNNYNINPSILLLLICSGD